MSESNPSTPDGAETDLEQSEAAIGEGEAAAGRVAETRTFSVGDLPNPQQQVPLDEPATDHSRPDGREGA